MPDRVGLELLGLRIEAHQRARQRVGDPDPPVAGLGHRMRAVLAGELADRQLHPRKQPAARQAGRGQLVLFDLARVAVEHPQDVGAFIGAIEQPVLADIRVVDEGIAIANQPLAHFGAGKFGACAIVLAGLERLAVEPLPQHLGDRPAFGLAGHRQHVFHLVDLGDPLLVVARDAGPAVADLVAIVALADKGRPVALEVGPGQAGIERGCGQRFVHRPEIGESAQRKVEPGRAGGACLLFAGRVLKARQADPDLDLAGIGGADRIGTVGGGIDGLAAFTVGVEHGDHRAIGGPAIGQGDLAAERGCLGQGRLEHGGDRGESGGGLPHGGCSLRPLRRLVRTRREAACRGAGPAAGPARSAPPRDRR